MQPDHHAHLLGALSLKDQIRPSRLTDKLARDVARDPLNKS